MEYKEIRPCSELAPHIHTFWELKGEDEDKQWERIFPDGCAGLVFNLGGNCITDNGAVKMDFGKTYVVGVMKSFKDSFIDADTHLFGVCLKAGVFPNFYNHAPQNEIIDKTIQLEKAHSFDIDRFIKKPDYYLNNFFLSKLQIKNGLLESVVKDIYKTQGIVSIGEIAKRNFITVRQLEREFKLNVGITPKEFANIVRFQNALSEIRKPMQERSLLDIAINCGYYDHSHLTNDIKKFTGIVPSQI